MIKLKKSINADTILSRNEFIIFTVNCSQYKIEELEEIIDTEYDELMTAILDGTGMQHNHTVISHNVKKNKWDIYICSDFKHTHKFKKRLLFNIQFSMSYDNDFFI